MLVALDNKAIAERWEIFKDVIQTCIPTTPETLPDRLQRMLQAALTGRIQCWLLYEQGDEFYGAVITKKSVDDLTGQATILIYALKIYKQASRETRIKDFEAFRRIVHSFGCSYFSAFCGSAAVANAVIKANGGRGEIINYVLVPVGE